MGMWKWSVLLVLAGCASGEGATVELPDALDDNITKIINGRFTFERPEVGLLNWNGSACTATLIRDNVAITAAHCVGFSTNDAQGRPLGSFIVHRDGQQVFRYSFDAHLAYGRDFNNGGDTDTDIALLRLIQRVPAEVATPARIADRQPRAGEGVTLFGYGCGDRNDTGDSHQGRKQKLPFASGRTTNLCPGDSGGPTFLDADGALFHINSAYNTGDGTDLFGDAVAMAATINRQADAWSGGQQEQAPPAGNGNQNQDLDCAGLFDCLQGCAADQACAQACARRTGAEPRRRYDAMVACSQANRCPDMTCVRDQCGAQVDACLGGDPGGGDPGGGDPGGGDPGEDPGAGDPGAGGVPQGGGLGCNDLLQCGQQCAGDQQCFSGCWGQADATAQQQYQAYSACFFGNNCQDGACAQQFCSGEYQACLAGNGDAGGFDNGDPGGFDNGGGGGFDNGGGSAGSCADVATCIQGCRDQACAQNCYFQGTFEAQLAFGALTNCALSNLCADLSCVQTWCADEYGICMEGQGFAGAPGGGCPNGGCDNGGCDNGGCANGGCDNGGCANGGCPNGGCPNGGANNVANGGLRCMDVIDCFGRCGDDACMNRCYSDGSAEARRAVDAIYDCAGNAGCQDFNCVEQRCAGPLNACF